VPGIAAGLLCHASPKASGASHARLRDSSVVPNGRRPKQWQSELMLKVASCSRKRDAETDRERQPRGHPQREGAADEAQVAVGKYS
jgi:hypothetical protein